MVMDTLTPTVVAQNDTVYLDMSGQASITVADIDNGSTDNCGIQTITLDSTNFDCSEVGPNTVTLTVTDVNNNTASATATVVVEDTLAPVAIPRNVTARLNAQGVASISVTQVDSASTDNCGINSMSISQNQWSCADTGVHVVMFTVVDLYGNSDSATFNVTVVDERAPDMVANTGTFYVDTNGIVVISPTSVDGGSTDNCGLDSIWLSRDTLTCADLGLGNLRLYGKDASGNESFAPFLFNLLDTIAPSITCPGAVTVCETDTILFPDATAADNCSVSAIFNSAGVVSGTRRPAGNYTAEFEAVDGSGNSATCLVPIEVLPAPIPNLGSDTAYGIPSLITLSSGVTGDHLWSTGDTSSSITFEFLTDTVISVSVTGSNGCVGTDEIRIQGLLSDKLTAESPLGIRMYPNPTNGEFSIEFSNAYEEEVNVLILDFTGKQVESRTILRLDGNRIEQFDLTQYSQGIYFVNVFVNGERITERITVY
jgi:hypothetical protein